MKKTPVFTIQIICVNTGVFAVKVLPEDTDLHGRILQGTDLDHTVRDDR